MTYKIDTISKAEYPEVVEVWEASVRATHHFLDEKDIVRYHLDEKNYNNYHKNILIHFVPIPKLERLA